MSRHVRRAWSGAGDGGSFGEPLCSARRRATANPLARSSSIAFLLRAKSALVGMLIGDPSQTCQRHSLRPDQKKSQGSPGKPKTNRHRFKFRRPAVLQRIRRASLHAPTSGPRHTCPSLAPPSRARLVWLDRHGRICLHILDRASAVAHLLALDSGVIRRCDTPRAPWPAAGLVVAAAAAALGLDRARSCSAVYLEVDPALDEAHAHHKLSAAPSAIWNVDFGCALVQHV